MKASEIPPPVWTFLPSRLIEQPARTPSELGQRVRSLVSELGLIGVGFAPATELMGAGRALDAWLAAGYHGTMQYLASPARNAPRALLGQACTLVVTAARYCAERPGSRRLPLLGQVAGYAHGPDYHGSLRRTLAQLGQAISDQAGRNVTARACVDTAPLLEREAARAAGLGFIGKSNMLILPGMGSRVLLGVLLVDIEIAAGATHDERCGTCNACIQACPTQAFVGPWVLDARRCISYLTIEFRGWLPLELRPLMGTRVFGCDVCQDVCPFNHGTRAKSLVPESATVRGDLAEALHTWLRLTSSGYRRLAAESALRRTSRVQLLRNAAVAAGNSGLRELTEPLRALRHVSSYPLVPGHAAWGLGRLGGEQAMTALEAAAHNEPDERARAEITTALKACEFSTSC